MGNYFVMSMRFNKCNASDFGFILKDKNTAINPNDNSIWIKASLYDFGWGKENGFYKDPLPCFDSLFEIALYSTNSDDMYGAAGTFGREAGRSLRVENTGSFGDDAHYRCLICF